MHRCRAPTSCPCTTAQGLMPASRTLPCAVASEHRQRGPCNEWSPVGSRSVGMGHAPPVCCCAWAWPVWGTSAGGGGGHAVPRQSATSKAVAVCRQWPWAAVGGGGGSAVCRHFEIYCGLFLGPSPRRRANTALVRSTNAITRPTSPRSCVCPRSQAFGRRSPGAPVHGAFVAGPDASHPQYHTPPPHSSRTHGAAGA